MDYGYKLSIIVPVYNCEKYLEKCLDSLLSQDLEDKYEIIVVNDGSSDGSQLIIDSYKKLFPDKIKSYIKKNGGQSSARNLGLEYASGEFISFVDSDDWLDTDFYTKGIKEAEEKNLDVIVYDMIDHYPTYFVHHHCSAFDNKFKMTMSASNKIFRASSMENLRFMKGVWYEDLEFTAKYLLLNDNIGRVDSSYYHCHCREESTMTNQNSPKNLDIIKVFDSIISYAKDNKVYLKNKGILTYMIIDHILITSINRVAKQNHPQKEEVISILRKYVIKQVPNIKLTLRDLGFSRNRILIARLNEYKLHNISKMILRISAKSKGR